MKNTKRSILCLSVLSALILTGCNKSGKDLAPAGWDDGVVWTSAGETEYSECQHQLQFRRRDVVRQHDAEYVLSDGNG